MAVAEAVQLSHWVSSQRMWAPSQKTPQVSAVEFLGQRLIHAALLVLSHCNSAYVPPIFVVALPTLAPADCSWILTQVAKWALQPSFPSDFRDKHSSLFHSKICSANHSKKQIQKHRVVWKTFKVFPALVLNLPSLVPWLRVLLKAFLDSCAVFLFPGLMSQL